MGLPYLLSPIWRNGVSSEARDVIALRVHQHHDRRFAADLPAEDEAGFVGYAAAGVLGLLADADPAQVIRRLAHVRDAQEAPRQGVTDIAFELRDDPLAGREVARAEQHELPFSGHAEDAHLAVGPDLVGARVGAGIRRKNKTFVDGDGETIGHVLGPFAGIGTPKIWPLSYTTPGVLRRRDPGALAGVQPPSSPTCRGWAWRFSNGVRCQPMGYLPPSPSMRATKALAFLLSCFLKLNDPG